MPVSAQWRSQTLEIGGGGVGLIAEDWAEDNLQMLAYEIGGPTSPNSRDVQQNSIIQVHHKERLRICVNHKRC